MWRILPSRVLNFLDPMMATSGNVRSENRVTDFRDANLPALPFSDWVNSPPGFRYPNTDPAGRRRAHDHATGPCGSAERPGVPTLPLAPSARPGTQRVQRCAAPRRALPRPVRGWVWHDEGEQPGSAKDISVDLVHPVHLQIRIRAVNKPECAPVWSKSPLFCFIATWVIFLAPGAFLPPFERTCVSFRCRGGRWIGASQRAHSAYSREAYGQVQSQGGGDATAVLCGWRGEISQ